MAVDLATIRVPDGGTLAILREAGEESSNGEVNELYDRFVQTRQMAMIQEIRSACGITAPATTAVEPDEPDEPAADVIAGTAQADQAVEGWELETV